MLTHAAKMPSRLDTHTHTHTRYTNIITQVTEITSPGCFIKEKNFGVLKKEK